MEAAFSLSRRSERVHTGSRRGELTSPANVPLQRATLRTAFAKRVEWQRSRETRWGHQGGAVRARILGTVAALASLAMAAGSSGADPSGGRAALDRPAHDKDRFQIVVVRGSMVTRVTETGSGEILEVTLREAPRRSTDATRREHAAPPPRHDEREHPAPSMYFVYIDIDYPSYQGHFPGLVPVRHSRHHHLGQPRPKAGPRRLHPHGVARRFRVRGSL